MAIAYMLSLINKSNEPIQLSHKDLKGQILNECRWFRVQDFFPRHFLHGALRSDTDHGQPLMNDIFLLIKISDSCIGTLRTMGEH